MLISHSAGGIVIGPQGRVLIVNQKHRAWSLPKGHVEAGETHEEAARREIAEETGVTDLELLGELGSYSRFKLNKTGGDSKQERKHLHFFAYLTPTLKLAPQDPDNPEARWLHPTKIEAKLTHPKDKEFVQNHLPRALAMACCLVKTTFPDEQTGTQLHAQILAQNLAACLHLSGPITSTYTWEGKPETSPEWASELVVFRPKLAELMAFIQENHPYQVPQLLVTPLIHGSLAYLSWVTTAQIYEQD